MSDFYIVSNYFSFKNNIFRTVIYLLIILNYCLKHIIGNLCSSMNINSIAELMYKTYVSNIFRMFNVLYKIQKLI